MGDDDKSVTDTAVAMAVVEPKEAPPHVVEESNVNAATSTCTDTSGVALLKEGTTDSGEEEAQLEQKSDGSADLAIDNKQNDSDGKQESVKPPPPRPIKRARTAYFIFADDKRPALQAAHPGEGVAVVARLMGQAWGTLPEEERSNYQLRAAQERARVAKEIEDYKALYGDSYYNSILLEQQQNSSNGDGLVLPVARIRKICKLDPEVRGMSKEATILITKCAEFALEKLGTESVKVARLQNRRKLLPDDVAQVCSSREQYLFLQQDVKDLLKQQVEDKHLTSKQQNQQKAAADIASSSSKPLTDYFGASNGAATLN